jgi:hypothetical protein
MHQIRQRTQTNTRPYFTCGGLSSEEMKKQTTTISITGDAMSCAITINGITRSFKRISNGGCKACDSGGFEDDVESGTLPVYMLRLSEEMSGWALDFMYDCGMYQPPVSNPNN